MGAALKTSRHSFSRQDGLRRRLFTLAMSVPMLASLVLVTAAGAPLVLAAGADHSLAFTAQPADAVAGVPMATVTVSILDSHGDPTSSTATVTLQVTGSAATLGGTASVAASDGIATFSDLTIDHAGTYTLDASSDAPIGATSLSFTITAASPDHLAFVGSPADASAGGVIGNVAVGIYDEFGNLTDSTATVDVVISGATPPTLNGTTSANAIDGTATFDDLSIDIAGPYTLDASSEGISGATSDSFGVAPGDADHLVVDSQPGNAIAGELIGPVSVGIYDRYGNLTHSTAPVGLVISGLTPPTLHGTASVNAIDGTATFDDLSIRTAGTYTLDASSGFFTVTTDSFAIDSAAFDHFVVTTPSTTVAGAPFTVTVSAVDTFGNVKTDYAGTISFSSSDGLPFAATVPDSYHFGSGDAGSHTFTDGVTLFNAPSQTVDVTDSVKTGTATVSVTPGADDHLSFDAQPAGAAAGSTLAALQVGIYDEYGNLTHSTAPVGLVISGLTPPTLFGTTPRDANNGTAHFGDLSVRKTGTYTIDASSGSLIGATSTSFLITPAILDHFTVSAPLSTVAGAPFSVTVKAYDQYNNLKTDYLGTITFSSSNPAPFVATLPEAYPFGSGDAGSHTFTNGVTLYNTTSQTVSVSDSGSSGLATVGVTPAILDHFTWDQIDTPQKAGLGFGIRVTAFDRYANVKTNINTGTTLGTNIGNSPNGMRPTVNGAYLDTSPNLTWSSGIGTANIIATNATQTDSLPGVTQKFTITAAAADGSLSADSGFFAVKPNDVATLTFFRQPVDTAQVNTSIYGVCAPPPSGSTKPCADLSGTAPLSLPVTVYVVDSWGNPVLQTQVSITPTPNTPNSLAAIAQQPSTVDGYATFGTLLTETSTGTGFQLRATAGVSPNAKSVDSNKFRIATSVTGCPGQASGTGLTTCTNKAQGTSKTSNYFVYSWSQITTKTCFFCGTTKILQSTQLVANSNATQCGVSSFASDMVDQRVTGANTQATSGGYELIVIPKATLKFSGFLNRSAYNFNICFGAIWIGSGQATGWFAKTSATSTTVRKIPAPTPDPSVQPQQERWYGILADCGTKGLASDKSDPCILKRTKAKSDIQNILGTDAASIMSDADLGIIVRIGDPTNVNAVVSPWDGSNHPF